jgi:hypothetical protein
VIAKYSERMDETGNFCEQYWQQLSAAEIKVSFTLFEVFLKESAHDLLRRYESGPKNLLLRHASMRIPQVNRSHETIHAETFQPNSRGWQP